jgi:hypothetical protein
MEGYLLQKYKIIIEDESELADYEAINKGYRLDVFVKVEEDYYKLSIYNIVRLQQEFMDEVEEYGSYAVDPNLVLVEEVDSENIKKTIERLFNRGFFQHLKPVDKSIKGLE